MSPRNVKRITRLPLKLNLNARALTDGSWSASDAFGCDGYAKMVVEIVYTYSAATDIQFYVQHSPDGTNYADEQSRTTAGGFTTLNDHIYYKATGGASGNWFVPIDINMNGNYRLQFTGTDADGSDTVTVYVHLETN